MIEEPKMSNENEVQEIELSITEARAKVDLSRKVDILIKNMEFDEIVNKGYLEKECIRLSHLLSDEQMASEHDQEQIIGRIKGIGYFRQYISYIKREGEMAKRAIASCEQELDMIQNESAVGE